MKLYELTYLISSDLSEEEVNSLLEEINSFIKENQGILEKHSPLLKKQLSYPIKKKATAYLANLTFQIEPERLKEIKKQIESKTKILRYLIVAFIKNKSKTRSMPTKVPIVVKRKESVLQKKIKLEEIEKKLEEIL